MSAQTRHRLGRRLLPAVVVGIAAAASALVVSGVPGAAVATTAASPPGPVTLTPASGTPRFADKPTGTTPDQIRQLVQCGSMMYAVGSFSVIISGTKHLARNDVFSFSASPPYTVSSFDPDVTLSATANGAVNSIAFNGDDCSHAYLGGQFSSVGAATAKNIAEVDTTTGALVTAFRHSASARVETIVAWNGHLLTGGTFTSINGSSANPYFASLSPTTGADDRYLALAISGNYQFTDQVGKTSVANPTEVYNQQISPDGARDLVEGDFTTMGGQVREQVAMLDLGHAAAATDAWYPSQFMGECSYNVPFYAQAASWSPDGSTVYFANTGYRPSNAPGDVPSQPRAGLCDAAVAFSLASDTQPLWINYTGCDSLFSTAADASTVYFAGHERWSQNPNGCDAAGTNPVPIDAPGMEGLSPTDGSLTSNPTRDRGLGADDMLITTAGLWIASDNADNSNQCGQRNGAPVGEHAGICLLPYLNPVATTPVVTGTTAVAGTVSCAEARQPAVAGQPAVTTSYTWLLAGTAVSHAASYVVPASAYGKSLACQASLQRGSGPVSSAAGPAALVAIGRALTATKAPVLARAPKVGHTDRVHRGTWSPRATEYTFQWFIEGKAVRGATAPAYKVPPRARGKRLRCRVTAGAAGYRSASRLTTARKVPKK